MATYKISWNPSTRVATAQDSGDTVPTGSTAIGTFVHDDAANDLYDTNDSHVLYHHVRDALYAQGVYDMQRVSIVTTIG